MNEAGTLSSSLNFSIWPSFYRNVYVCNGEEGEEEDDDVANGSEFPVFNGSSSSRDFSHNWIGDFYTHHYHPLLCCVFALRQGRLLIPYPELKECIPNFDVSI
ncbi:hypothetical protein U1Q18_002469 [Sarracenia purpurea var. burkii]